MLNEEVRKIMTIDPIVANPENTIQQVINVMTENKLQQMPVVKDGELCGLITSYDLWRSKQSHASDEAISKVMNTNVLTIRPKDKVGTAAELFIDKRFKTLPVVNLDNKLKGVVTAFDVIKHVFKKEYPNPILYKYELAK